MKIKKFMFLFLFLLLPTLVCGEIYSPADSRSISTGTNDDWWYTRIHKADNTNEYIGISKNDKGAIGIGDDGEIYGRIWLTPAFKHPSNSKWYLCPVRGMNGDIDDLGNGWYFNVSNTATTCYRYDDTSITGSADLDVQGKITTDDYAQTRIKVNVTVNGVSPLDTGFGFFIKPNNPQRYKYARTNEGDYELNGTSQQMTPDYTIEFLDDDSNPLDHVFDWIDMPAGENFTEIIKIGNSRGLLVGTYGYGASNFIEIDPLYSVDYSPEPGVLLKNGTVSSSTDGNFTLSENITNIISDNNFSTSVFTRLGVQGTAFGGSPIDGVEVLFNYKMEEISGSTMIDYADFQNDGVYYSGANLTTTGFNGFATSFDGVDDYAIINNGSLYNSNSSEDIMLCFGFKGTGNLPNGESIIDFRDGGNNGFEIRGADDEIKFTVDRDDSGAKNHDTTYSFTDTNWHSVCFYDSTSVIKSYVDGSVDGTTNTAHSGGISSGLNNVYIGTDEDMTDYMPFSIDELCYMKGINLNHSRIATQFNSTRECDNIGMDYTKGTAIKAKWNQTYDGGFEWFLRLYQPNNTITEVITYPYLNDTDVNNSINVTSTIRGIGWFNINVSSLVNYQTNTAGLNYTGLRFTSQNKRYFSEVQLRKESNDTEAPQFTNCLINDTDLSENDVARIQCNVTDNIEVDFVNGTLNGVSYPFTKNDDIYYYDYVCDSTENVNWTLVEAEDILNQYNSTNPNLSLNCTVPEDTCSPPGYPSVNGNWAVDFADHCNMTGSDINMNGYNITITDIVGDGTFRTYINITNFGSLYLEGQTMSYAYCLNGGCFRLD